MTSDDFTTCCEIPLKEKHNTKAINNILQLCFFIFNLL
jgi:hypothetical protein